MKRSHIALALIAVVAAISFLAPALELPGLDFLNWGVLAAIIATLLCLALFLEFETALV